jgi:uncharacterized heparinase superfamily protein
MLGAQRFRFLNRTHDLSAGEWDDDALEKLWRYNLHYFDDLNAARAIDRRSWHEALIEQWIRENPPTRGPGWEPYPTSLRIVNWIKWALAGNTPSASLIQSLAVQVRWLSSRMEFHLLGNHLFVNAKALVFAGSFFGGEEGDRWLSRGLHILEDQLPEQILTDGGQFELSTMYHALALEDLLDLYNVVGLYEDSVSGPARSLRSEWQLYIERMRWWLLVMSHPDCDIALFNDAAFGIAPSPGDLQRYADDLGLPALDRTRPQIVSLEQSGYIRIERGPLVAMLDVGRVGPDYLPAHAHADTLTFELSLFGQRVIVNSGTSCYGNSAERLRQRGTAAHNTVTVEDQNSSEVWAGFRVARRARPFGLGVSVGPTIVIQCAHDGYRRLKGKPIHRRQWTVYNSHFEIRDEIEGEFVAAEACFHLHPSIRVAESPPSVDPSASLVLELPDGSHVTLATPDGRLRVEASTWHPEFGLTVPSQCIVAAFAGAVLHTRVQWGDAE